MSKPLSQVVARFGDLSLVLWCYKRAVQHSLEDGKRAHQGEHRVGAEGQRQDGIGGLQAGCHHLKVGILGQRDFNGHVSWPTHCCHSLALLAFSLHVVHPSFGYGILAHGQDACKADCSGLTILKIVQVVGKQAPLAPISRKHSTPSPLPS